MYVSKDEDSEVVFEIPKGQRLSVGGAIEFVVLNVPKLKFSLAGVEDDQVVVKPEMKIANLPN